MSHTLMHNAIQAQQAGQYSKAKKLYIQLLENNPNSGHLHQLLGICHAQAQDLSSSIIHLKKATECEPNNPHFLASLANAYRTQGEYSLAKVLFLEVLRLEPGQLSALNNLGVLHYNEHNTDSAIDYLQQALALHPKFSDAHFNLGLCFLSKNDREQAKTHFVEAVACNPESIKALLQLGQLYQQDNAHHQALVQFEQVKHLDPKHAENNHYLGMTYLQLDRAQDGVAHLERALAVNPKLENLHHNLACVYLHQRQYQKALKHWLLHQQQESSQDTCYNIGVTYLYLGRYEEATDFFFQVLKEDPNHFETLTNLGACYLQQNKIDLAKTYYQRAQVVRSAPATAYILEALGMHNNGSTQHLKPAEKAPDDYVTDLFDHYAYHYEHHLSNVLQYGVPGLLKQLILAHTHPKEHSLRVFDLGCGTGLMGQAIAPYSSLLKGLDLSENMLDQARKKDNLYTSLVRGSLPEALKDERASSYDLMLAADVLPYLGELDVLLSEIARCLADQGYFACSIEATYSAKSVVLQHSARFAHNPETLIDQAKSHNLTLLSMETAKLRIQQKQHVEGRILLFQKQ